MEERKKNAHNSYMLKMLFGLPCSYIRWNPTLFLSLFPLWASVVWNSDYFPLSNESHFKKKWLTLPYSQFRCSVKPVAVTFLFSSQVTVSDLSPAGPIQAVEIVIQGSPLVNMCQLHHAVVRRIQVCAVAEWKKAGCLPITSWKLWLHKQDRVLGCNPAGVGAAWYFPVALPQNLGWFVK